VLRMTMLRTHYRSPIDWTLRALEESQKTLLNWANVMERSMTSFVGEGLPAATVVDALMDDLNTPKAIAEMHKLADAARKGDLAAGQSLHDTGRWLGLLDLTMMSSSDLTAVGQGAQLFMEPGIRNDIDSKVEARAAARSRKDFKESDRIRDELASKGVVLKDGKDADGKPVTTWEIAR